MTSRLFRRLALAYGPAFAVLYVLASARDLPLFTVYPTRMRVVLGTGRWEGAPAMHWYGWIATAAVGAFLFGLAVAAVGERWRPRLWPGWLWLIPLLAMVASVGLELAR